MTDQGTADAVIEEAWYPYRRKYSEDLAINRELVGFQEGWAACARHESQQDQTVRNAMIASIERLNQELVPERAARERLEAVVREVAGDDDLLYGCAHSPRAEAALAALPPVEDRG